MQYWMYFIIITMMKYKLHVRGWNQDKGRGGEGREGLGP